MRLFSRSQGLSESCVDRRGDKIVLHRRGRVYGRTDPAPVLLPRVSIRRTQTSPPSACRGGVEPAQDAVPGGEPVADVGAGEVAAAAGGAVVQVQGDGGFNVAAGGRAARPIIRGG